MNNFYQSMQMFSQFQQFASQFKNGKQNPQEMLDNLVNSGKVTQEQLQNAKDMAYMFKDILGGKKNG